MRTWLVLGGSNSGRAKRVVVVAALLLASCSASPNWTGFVYPDANNLTVSVQIGRFKTFEQCRASALETLVVFGVPDRGTFECGRDCHPSKDTGLNVCAETRD